VTSIKHRRLVRTLANGNEAERWEAAKALSNSCDAGTLRKVERVLQSDRDEGSRAAAAYVLGFSGESELAPTLARTLSDREESPVVRAYAAEGLGHLLQYETVLAEVRAAILWGLRDPEPEVRFWCAFAAGVLGLQESRLHLERLVGTDQEAIPGWWSVSEEAEWALRVLDGEEDPPLPAPRT
jgi:HEAT repeat protein